MIVKSIRCLLPPIILVAALLGYRVVLVVATPAEGLSLPRNEPLTVAPQVREDRVCTMQQLSAVLDRVKPPLDPIDTNKLVHALRLWGAEADFGDPAIPSGKMLRDYFLDDRVFQRLAGEESPPIFYPSPEGVLARGYDDLPRFTSTSSYHADDLLTTLAETGTPLDTPLHLRGGKAKVADLLTGALQHYYSDKMEYEWTILSYARYAYPLKSWRNKYGERIDMAALVDELLDKPPELGPCDGLHRLEAVVILCRIDEQARRLPPRSRARMLGYMKAVSDRLVQAQSVDGYWTSGWSQAESKVQSPGAREAGLSKAEPSLHDKLLVTGHHLEWLALAPEESQPPRETIVRAGQWLTRTLLEMDAKQLGDAYGPYSHAARALCLWKGIEPIKAWRLGQKSESREQRAELSSSYSSSWYSVFDILNPASFARPLTSDL